MRIHRVVAVSLVLVLLTPSLSLAITLREYEQARSDLARQAKIFAEAYDATVVRTLSSLRSATFPDGKTKTPARTQRDAEQAQRIEQFAAHLTKAQTDALMNLIAQYAGAQPETQLEAVITSYLLTESETPFQRYERSYRDFKARMTAWHAAENEAQVELNIEMLSLDDRRRQVDAPSSERIQALMKGFNTTPVIDEFIAAFLSPTDANGRPKGTESLDADTRRAAMVLEIGQKYDTNEVARRIYAAMKTGGATDPVGIFRGYVREELVKRGALAR